MQNLIKECWETLQRIRKVKSEFPLAEKRSEKEVYEYRLLGEMERDLEWVLRLDDDRLATGEPEGSGTIGGVSAGAAD